MTEETTRRRFSVGDKVKVWVPYAHNHRVAQEAFVLENEKDDVCRVRIIGETESFYLPESDIEPIISQRAVRALTSPTRRRTKRDPDAGLPIFSEKEDLGFDKVKRAKDLVTAIRKEVAQRFGFRLSPAQWAPRVYLDAGYGSRVVFLRKNAGYAPPPTLIADACVWSDETDALEGYQIFLI